MYITKYDSDLERAQDGTTEILGNVSNIANFKVSNATTVSGNVTAQALDLAANTSLSNLVEGAEHQMSLGSAQLGIGSQLSTTDLTIGNNSASVDDSWIMGAVNVADTLTIEAKPNNAGDNNFVIAGGNVSAKSTVLADGVNLYVGLDKDVFVDDTATDINEAASYTGSFETISLKLNGGILIVDPDYGENTALASVRNFADITSDTEFTDKSKVGTLDGSIFVGSNSALGIGTESIEDLASVIAPYQTNGSLSENLGAIVYLNGIATIAENQGLVMTNKSLTEFISYYNGNNGNQNDISDTSAPTIANTIFFGEGTALMVTANAVQKTDQNNALVTFESGDGTLVANGGEILISGDLRANAQTQYNLFADHGTDGSSKVSVKDIAGNEVGSGSGITITTENGFLVGEVNNDNGGQNITLEIAENGRSLMSGASDPVYDTLVAYVRGYNGDPSDVLYNGYIAGTQDKNTDYHNFFLAGAISQNGGAAAAETAARFSIYGGAPQAAMQAGKSSSDAIAARFGIGSAFSNLTIAANAQGATLWLAPVYKTSDSDGFEAQGVDYGVDIDLYGVALGADYTLANGITFGAMFNVGSGEVDGEGAASSTSNDFDYYGFGAYLGYQYQAFSVMADISYTTADNEIEAHTSVDRIGAQLDSTNISVGVTGKYDLAVNGVKVTPHVGVRFSNIDLDDYTIDGREVVGSATSDDMNIFSIPVGVTIAKEFKSETWTVAPSFDLTLTGQFGDDELDGAISWAGVSNLTTSTTTEVFDNFTYGATLGVEAENVNGVAFGIGVNYTGSSNVDEFGVNANARFTF